ncbi:MAG TPA: MmcQ/YjbR family DNA-binding protein [Longimicrobiales bacterium]
MTAAEFRKIALSFPEATESSHHGHPDFRVGGKIFATLGYPDASCGVVMLTPDDQAFYMKIAGNGFTPAKGEWGRKGSTVVTLRSVKRSMVRAALEAAWQRRAPKRLLKEQPEARW